MPQYTGQAPGKVILLGEHAVVYGQPALACAIPREVRVCIEPVPGPLRVVSSALGLNAPVEPETSLPGGQGQLVRACARVCERLGAPEQGATIQIESDLPVGRGLGSSAALSIALLRAVGQWTGQGLDRTQLLALGLELEKVFHGNPSGLDHATVLSEGLLVFSKGGRREVVRCPEPVQLVLVDSGGERQTSAMVAEVRRRYEAHPTVMAERIEAIGAVVAAGIEALRGGALSDFGAIMLQNQALLCQLGVSTPRLDALIDAAMQAGALGAKLSGAGGGGVVVCLCDDRQPEHASQRILALAAREGLSAFAVELPAGVENA